MMIFFGEIAAHSTKHWQRGKVSFLKRKYKNKNKLKFQKPHFYVKSHHKSQNRLLFLQLTWPPFGHLSDYQVSTHPLQEPENQAL